MIKQLCLCKHLEKVVAVFEQKDCQAIVELDARHVLQLERRTRRCCKEQRKCEDEKSGRSGGRSQCGQCGILRRDLRAPA